MSTQKRPVLTITRKAAAALTKFQLVTAAGALAAAGEAATGAVTHDAPINTDCAVDVLGTTTLIASAAVLVGAKVQVASDGKAVTATTGVPVAIALEAAGADEPFEALLTPGLPAIGGGGGGGGGGD